MKSSKERPTIIVVFGATGDLFRKKLARALFDLFKTGHLPSPFRVVGFSRRFLTHEEFREQIKEIILPTGQKDEDEFLNQFTSHAFYEKGDIANLATYRNLGNILAKMDEEAGVCMNKLFYLAVPPELYRTVFENLSHSGLTIPCAPGAPEEKMAWSRVLVEKPFGSDQKEASDLDALLGRLFTEDQIFRIDHYLAKETIQNILTFRFSNGLFESLWNNRHIEKVEIKLLESKTAASRGLFYDKIGALRDVGQNHILAMLALVAMENPGELSAETIRNARKETLVCVKPLGDAVEAFAMRGQYKGYLEEKGVAAYSDTETYFKIKMGVDNDRWRGVPFYLESGKGLRESLSEIIVYFKELEMCICPKETGEHSHQNIITFRIQPNEAITVLFWAKQPGFDFGLETRSLSFSYHENDLDASESRKIPDAYERVLFDCIRGDQTLFASTDEVTAEWNIITPILEAWKKVPLQIYPLDGYPRDTIL